MLRKYAIFPIVIFLLANTFIPLQKITEAGDVTYHQRTVLGRGSARIIDWSPDDELIAVGGTGGVWFYTSTLQLVSHLDVGHVSAMAWTPNDNHIAVATMNGDLVMWDTTTLGPLFELNGHTDTVVSLAWNSDGTLLASGSLDETVRIWDGVSGELVETLTDHVGQVHAISWNADDTRLATASSGSSNSGFVPNFRDASTIIWNTQTWEKWYEPELDAPAIDMAWHPVDPTILALNLNMVEALWIHDTESPETINIEGANEGFETGVMEWRPDGSQLALAVSSVVMTFDATNWEHVSVLRGSNYGEFVYSFTWSRNGDNIAVASYSNKVTVWTVTGDLVAENDTHLSNVNSIGWSLDGETVLSAGEIMTLWDVQTSEKLDNVVYPTDSPRSYYHDVAWNPLRNQAAFIIYFSVLSLIDPESGEVVLLPFSRDDSRTCLAWNSEGNLLASGGEDGFIRIWNPTTQEQVNSYEMPYKILAIDWSADDSTIVIGGENGELQLLDLASEDIVSIASGENEAITDVKFSPDGQYIASASDSIIIWDAESGDQLLTLDGHTEGVLSISWHPDGLLLASGGVDDMVRIWDTSTGEMIATLDKHVDDVTDVEWSPDGSLLASASLDGTIRIWERE